MILKWVWREFKSQPALAASLTLTLFLGLLAFNSIDIVRFAVADSLQKQSKVLLAADLALTSRRPLTPAELKAIKGVTGEDVRTQEIYELYTMARGKKNSRLVQLKAVPRSFPFYGDLNLTNKSSVSDLNDRPRVWVHPELLTQLQLKLGDPLKIGDTSFEISDIVEGDFVNSWKGLSLAPKIYLGFEQLAATHLVKPGSTVSYNYLIKLNDPQTLKVKYRKLNALIKDPGIRVYDDEKASQEIVRGLTAISDYLGLVAIVALLLAGLGIYFLFNGYILRKRAEIAIYNSLGLTRNRTVLIYCLYLAIIGGIALLPTWLISFSVLPFVNHLIRSFMPFAVQSSVPFSVLLISFLIAALSIGVATLSVLLRIKMVSSAQLFREDREFPLSSKTGKIMGLGLTSFLIWILALYQSQSLIVSTYFLLGLVAVLLTLSGVGVAFIKFLGRYADRCVVTLRLALKSLSRQPSFSLFTIMAIGTAFFLTILIPLIREGLINEMRQPPGLVLPNLFLFDIQDEQEPELEKVLTHNGYRLEGISPMVRARLMEVNGEPFEKAQMPTLTTTREEDTEARFRNRGVNLSFRGELNDSESIIEGKFYLGGKDPSAEWAEISVEKFFLEQLRLKLGDKIVFDVQGVPVKGIVTSIRSVRWNSFLPNFFILVQPGVLEEAPKTYLAAIKGLPADKISEVQNLIVDKFPNISVVDVRRTVDRITLITQTMTRILEIMSYLCLAIGFVILVAVLYHHGEGLRREWDLLSILGMVQSKVRQSHILRMTLLGLIAGLVAGCAAVIVSRVMLDRVFEVYVRPPEGKYIFLGLLSLYLMILSVSYFVYGILRRRIS